MGAWERESDGREEGREREEERARARAREGGREGGRDPPIFRNAGASCVLLALLVQKYTY